MLKFYLKTENLNRDLAKRSCAPTAQECAKAPQTEMMLFRVFGSMRRPVVGAMRFKSDVTSASGSYRTKGSVDPNILLGVGTISLAGATFLVGPVEHQHAVETKRVVSSNDSKSHSSVSRRTRLVCSRRFIEEKRTDL